MDSKKPNSEEDNEWITVDSIKKKNFKKLYIKNEFKKKQVENQISESNQVFNSKWEVWIRNNYATDWSVKSYRNPFTIHTVSSFWSFFNNFSILDRTNNQIFIMRNDIQPVWEDPHNINGGICSIRLNYILKKARCDIGSEVMTAISCLIINESLVLNNEMINGVSYSLKSKHLLIKIWVSNYEENKDFIKCLPSYLIKEIENMCEKENCSNSIGNVSVQFKHI